MVNKSLLQNIYLFKKMTNEEVETIASLSEIQLFNFGEEIFAQQDRAFALYVIKYGSVRIYQKSSFGDLIEVANLGTGSHFGEMGLLDNEPRSAFATSLEKSEIVVIPYETLRKVLENRPEIAVKFYRELALFLCGRLRMTTHDLSFSREKNLSHF
ncbi:MAG: cyclic nucleotide-binding domain-containing protein [Bdellovibrionales bacterium]|nr:cyclic nucleotide-binding domain-containing protein [Bdellovibrionales bacterium]